MKIKTLLNEEIVNELEELGKLEIGSEAYKTTVDGLSKLIDKSIDIERMDNDYELKFESMEKENELKRNQTVHNRKDNWIKNGLTAISILGYFGLTIWGTCKTLKYEETDSITTTAGREFSRKLFSKLKI